MHLHTENRREPNILVGIAINHGPEKLIEIVWQICGH
jgi:hypothetical protein